MSTQTAVGRQRRPLSPRHAGHTLTAVLAAIALGLTASSAAHAVPSPNTGPTAGGTDITDTLSAETRIVQTSGNGESTVIRTAAGGLFAWGSNSYGELGNGTTAPSATPVAVHMPTGVTATSVSAAMLHTVAEGSDGNAYAWGENSNGQLGIGTTENVSVPTLMQNPSDVTLSAVQPGLLHTVALGSDGRVYSAGYNGLGQLGNGSTKDSSVPVAATGPDGVAFTAVSAGRNFTVALGSDGNAYAWGDNASGQLGNTDGANSSVPVPVKRPDGVTLTSISAGNSFVLALGSDGKAYGWGSNNTGQLGVPGISSSAAPVPVQAPEDVTFSEIQASAESGFAVGSDAKLYAWGVNVHGGLGTGSVSGSPLPIPVKAPAGVTLTAPNANYYHTLAMGSDGALYAWGLNSAGQLGDGTTTTSRVPVRVLFGEFTIDSVQLGDETATGLVQTGSTWAATTPAHACGVVDVTVNYTQFGQQQTHVITDGFTYGSLPIVDTHPQSVTLESDQREVTLTAAASGDHAPSVQWQHRSGDSEWSDAPEGTHPAHEASPEHSTEYRAVFTNCLGSVTSEPALVTVPSDTKPKPEPGKPDQKGDAGPKQTPAAGLPNTGSAEDTLLIAGAAALIALGAGAFTVRRRRG